MSHDYLVIIGSIFGVFCYFTEFVSVYKIFITLHENNKFEENKNLNIYGWKLRFCIITANGFYLTYNKLNNFTVQMYCFLFYFGLDSIILLIRSYYLYWYYKNILPNTNNDYIENPIHISV
jgi:hypothetical protein